MSHTHSHSHPHIEPGQARNETRTWQVLILTLCMMVVEITTGFITGSMALLADGWHMGTHSAAFGISIFAYRYARTHRSDGHFSFGPGKVNSLGGFASAVALAVVALFMIIESVERLFNPITIQFTEAIIVACIGLVVNILSALLLMGGSSAKNANGQMHADHNLRSAYFHVLADALTSVLAIVALFMAMYLGWTRIDPFIGILGAIIILRWAYTLTTTTSEVLLDKAAGNEAVDKIRSILAEFTGADKVELRVWYTGVDKLAAAVHLHPEKGLSLAALKTRLTDIPELAYVNIELEQ